MGTLAKTINNLKLELETLENYWGQIAHGNSSIINEYDKKIRQPYSQMVATIRNLSLNLRDIDNHFKPK